VRFGATAQVTGLARLVFVGFQIPEPQAANRYETWIESRSPGHVAAMRQFMKQMQAQVPKAA
jgi:hypothetical protein